MYVKSNSDLCPSWVSELCPSWVSDLCPSWVSELSSSGEILFLRALQGHRKLKNTNICDARQDTW